MAEQLQHPEQEPLDPITEYALLFDECRDALQQTCAPEGPARVRFGAKGSICVAAGYVQFGWNDSRCLVLIDSVTAADGHEYVLFAQKGVGDEPGEHTNLHLSKAMFDTLQQEGFESEHAAQEFADLLDAFRFVLREVAFDPHATDVALEMFSPAVGDQQLAVPQP